MVLAEEQEKPSSQLSPYEQQVVLAEGQEKPSSQLSPYEQQAVLAEEGSSSIRHSQENKPHSYQNRLKPVGSISLKLFLLAPYEVWQIHGSCYPKQREYGFVLNFYIVYL